MPLALTWTVLSLQATWIRKIITNGLRSCTRVNTRNISTAFVYENPTISALAEFVADLVSPKEMAQIMRSEVEQMLTLVGKYSNDFPEHNPSTVLGKKKRGGDVILITGTTGSVGASTLAELLESPKVERVYALNRPHKKGLPLVTRQKRAFTSQGLKGDLVLSEKLVMLEGDLGRPCLGLEESVQRGVCNKDPSSRPPSSCTSVCFLLDARFAYAHYAYRYAPSPIGIFPSSVIFHTWLNVFHRFPAAWRVDFNLTLLSFETYIADLRRLIDFALSCRLPEPPRFLFLSSIAAVSRLENLLPILEHAVPAAAAIGSGYGESKWVAEALLIEAIARTPLHVVIVRSGQVSGGLNGYWNSSDWFPSMIQSASSVKCLPLTSTERVSTYRSYGTVSLLIFVIQQTVSFIPLDVAAKAIADMRDSPTQILHLAHPSPVPWNSVIRRTADILSVPLVYYRDWVSRLERVGDDGDSSESPSVLRLLDFSPKTNLDGLLESPGGSSDIIASSRLSELKY